MPKEDKKEKNVNYSESELEVLNIAGTLARKYQKIFNEEKEKHQNKDKK